MILSIAYVLQVVPEDFIQPARLWEVLGRTPGQQENLIRNVAGHLCGARERIRRRTYEMFYRTNEDLGARIERATEDQVPRSNVHSAATAPPDTKV